VTVASPKSQGELAFQTYLDSRCLPNRYETATSGPRPDFEVDHPVCGRVVMDVHEPVYRLPHNPDGSYHSGFITGPEEALRRAIDSGRKKRQAQSAVEQGHPFVIVLARTNSEMAFESFQVAAAMFGALQITFPVGDDPPAPVSRTLTFGPGARLQPEINTRFSAVAVLTAFNPWSAEVERLVERQFVTGMSPGQHFDTLLRVIDEQTNVGRYGEDDREHRLTIFHNPFAKVPLSPQFAGAYDDQWLHDGDRSYQEASWGIRGNDVPGRVALG
jgi:hypothetical protein